MERYQSNNLFISASLFSILVFLLWLGSHSTGIVFFLTVFVFSFLALTNYAMMHEAMHCNLHSNTRINQAVGVLLSWMFPVSFTFVQTAHNVHHKYNRTDHEMFDYYYATDNLLIKFLQWYSILFGIYPPIIPVGCVLISLCPGFFMTTPWQKAKSSSIVFNPNLYTKKVLQKIRFEVVMGVLVWMVFFNVLNLDLYSVGILYIAAWVNWSTRQYVTHAFSPRDIINGAHNLKVSPIMSMILLNSNWDLVHHQYPHLVWQELPKAGQNSREAISYWRQYVRMWAGPRPNTEPAPVYDSTKVT